MSYLLDRLRALWDVVAAVGIVAVLCATWWALPSPEDRL